MYQYATYDITTLEGGIFYAGYQEVPNEPFAASVSVKNSLVTTVYAMTAGGVINIGSTTFMIDVSITIQTCRFS